MDANVSTMTMPKTMPVQNLCRYISFEFVPRSTMSRAKVERGRNAIGQFCIDDYQDSKEILVAPLRYINAATACSTYIEDNDRWSSISKRVIQNSKTTRKR